MKYEMYDVIFNYYPPKWCRLSKHYTFNLISWQKLISFQCFEILNNYLYIFYMILEKRKLRFLSMLSFDIIILWIRGFFYSELLFRKCNVFLNLDVGLGLKATFYHLSLQPLIFNAQWENQYRGLRYQHY